MSHGTSIESCRWRRVETVFIGGLLLAPLVFDPWDGPCPVSQYKGAYILLAALLLAVVFSFRPFFRCGFRFNPSLIDLPAALLLILAGLSVTWAVNAPIHLQRFTLLLAVGVCFYMVRMHVVEGDRPTLFLGMLLAVGAAAALLDGGYILYTRFLSCSGAAAEASFKTNTLLFPHNNVASIYAVLLPPLAFALLFQARRRAGKVLAGAAFLLFVGYLLLLESRAALFETVAAVLFVFLGVACGKRCAAVLQRLSRLLWKRSVLLLVALLLAAVFLLPLSREFSSVAKAGFSRAVTLLDLQYERAYFRLDVWRKTMAMVGDHFFFGVGLGNFPVVFPAYHKRDLPKAHAHSEYFQILAELGVLGLVLYLLFLVLLFRAFVNAFLYSEKGERPVVLGLGGAVFAELIHGLVEPPLLFESSALVLACCFGLLAGLEGKVVPRSVRDFGPWTGVFRFAPPLVAVVCLAAAGPKITGLFRQGVLLRHADTAMNRGRIAEAERLYRRVATLGWDSYVAHLNIGRACFQAGKFEAALEEFHKAQVLYPNYYMIYFDQGITLLRLGRAEEADVVLRKCLELNPCFSQAQIYRAHSLVERGRYEEAYGLLERYLRSRKPTAAEFKFAGDLFYKGSQAPGRTREERIRDLKRAVACYDHTLALDKGSAYPELARLKGTLEQRLREVQGR